MKKKGRCYPGWVASTEYEFKAAIMAAMKTQPDLCKGLRYAIEKTTARRGVRTELRLQFILWVEEVEAALAAVAEAEQPRPTPESTIQQGA